MLIMGFLLLTALTVVAVLGANIGVFGEAVRTSFFAEWGLTAVIAEIVGAIVFAFKWSLSSPKIRVLLDFSPRAGVDVYLDPDNCTYQVRDEGGIINEGKVTVTLEEGWQCTLPSTTKPEDSITLSLVERDGRKWEVRPFYPFAVTKQPNERGD